MNARAGNVRLLRTMVLALGVAGMAATELPAVPTAQRASQDRTVAPDFTLPDTDGTPIRLSAFKGRVVLLDFWATWCTGCKVEIPWYMEFQRKYAGKGLTSIGVAMDDEGWPIVKPYLHAIPSTIRSCSAIPRSSRPTALRTCRSRC